LNFGFASVMTSTKPIEKQILEKMKLSDVNCPFHIYVPAGESSFTVPIPTIFADRKFYFADLILVPDFYNVEAEELGLDVDAELNETFSYDIHLTAQYGAEFLPGVFNLDTNIKTTPEALEALNLNFEAIKPVGLEHLVHFWDWTDIRFHPSETTSWDDWVRNTMAVVYYGEAFDPVQHFNKLPPSARTVMGANNYLFPTQISEILLENLRFRMWAAPNTNLYYSTDGQLKLFGFAETQIPPRGARQQLIYPNSKNSFGVIVAQNPLTIDISLVQALKISLGTNQKGFVSDVVQASITLKEKFKNENYDLMMRNVFKPLTNACNLQIGLFYDKDTKIFKFSFPNNAQLNVDLHLPTELAQRMGFGQVTQINKANQTSDPVEDQPNVKHTEKKARALAYDTGTVIVSDDNTQSNTTPGLSGTFMMALFPTETGSLAPSSQSFCLPPVTMQRPRMLTGGPGTYPANFKLSRYFEKNHLVNLVWKNGAYATGVLRGVPI